MLVVGAQVLEQSMDRIVSNVKLARRHQSPIFGEQQEDQSHQHSEQAGVNIVGMTFEHSQQFVQRVEHLLGQRGRDSALILSALD